ncbi:MAG: hypothetical protein HYX48_01745 [Chlamydiales bacterium]|nr:hypothetical protein [Chlamydiales bacterium]
MNLSNDEKKYILDEYLRHISHFLDGDYQKRVWILREGPECQAFDDAVCDFFDIGEPILEDYKNFGITEMQHALLLKLHDEFRKFSETHDMPENFLSTQEWNKIKGLARDVLIAFNYRKIHS